jgi:dimethyladenosine transferase 1
MYGLTARETLSQNFIFDMNLTSKIVKAAKGVNNKTVIEVGPGPGSLTRSIISEGCNKLVVVEKDNRFLPALNMLKDSVKDYGVDMEVEINDILHVDEESLLKKIGTQPVVSLVYCVLLNI